MTFGRRIRTVYRKELIDILRDSRTLIAMIVVPIVLYPLLTIGSLQVVTAQVGMLHEETMVVGVLREQDAGDILRPMIVLDAEALAKERAAAQDAGTRDARTSANAADGGSLSAAASVPPPEPIEKVEYRLFASRESLERAVSERRVHVGVVFPPEGIVDAPERSNRIEILADTEEVRSRKAAQRLTEMLARTQQRLVDSRLRQEGLPSAFIEPFQVATVDLSTPQSLLGQILPLILVLMTITGAIYPAIDLTAGERERGTLESLMVSPVPVLELIVGKFLVVATVAILGAALNLASMTATVYFGGFGRMMGGGAGTVPLGGLVLILVCLVPFAVLMSAIMIAVCSYARTFKEAQNYVMPVILLVLVPGGLAALPTAQFEGAMLVAPVGNMVLLARELLWGAYVPAWKILLVLGVTTLYAAAAVAVAAGVFGKESVVFSDAASLRTTLMRGMIRPAPRPSVPLALLVTALLFPVWFFVQASFSPGPDEDVARLLRISALLMPVLFVLLPGAVLWYWKVDLTRGLSLRAPSPRFVLAGVLLGLTLWVPAHELTLAQLSVFPIPEGSLKSLETFAETLRRLPEWHLFLYIALVPALCEELFFRGILLGGLAGKLRRWPAILVAGAVFGIFHFVAFKFLVTAVLGVVLGYLCWQSRSILPGMIAHFLHNGLQALTVAHPGWNEFLGITSAEEAAHLPPHVLGLGGLLVVVGWLLAVRPARTVTTHS
ncbi:MAG TPA: ABC transporter permease subunit/CPBP intramembrane protease [Phycisphaerae bacterium]|nr:ABC transporter permease subunit/CPBP intramembrane protease [Phycisphaerae bacterium]HNU44315.1 ABC transporter permease subunit/CPBP intramembrane protease [Phycisphaerae bacterium]